jgi:hypothetical protein
LHLPAFAHRGVNGASARWRASSARIRTLDLRLQLSSRGSTQMLWTIALFLIILWALGMVTSYTAAGLIHVLLVIALVIVVIRVVQGRRIIN